MASAIEIKSFVFRFADVTVREREFAIAKAGKARQVEPKAFQVLLILIRNPNQLIAKEELLSSVWGETAVTENSLARNIALLRRLLGDDPRSPRFIETVSSIGYRFICPVEVAEDAPAPSAPTDVTSHVNGYVHESPPANQPGEGKKPVRRRWLALAAILVLGLIALGWYLRRPLPPPRIVEYRQLTHDGHQKFPAGTDGSRVYFTNFAGSPVSQVAVSGGEIAPVPIPLTYVSHVQSVSPDGSSLIIDTDEQGIIFNRPQWKVSTLGGSLRRLPDGAGATFSPDGQTVVYSTKGGGVWLVRSDGTGARTVATLEGAASGFAWSPNGNTIRFGKENRLWEMSSDGSNPHPLLIAQRAPGGQCCGHWTADGKFFLFRSGDLGTGDTGIWAIDERRRLLLQPRKEPVQLTNGPIRWNSLVPAKDAKTIFAEGETLRGELFRYDAQTKHFLPFLGGISAGCVAFSKDAQFVAYVLYPEGTLWKANRDGSNPVRLSDPQMSAHSPRWSPDGKQIAFTDLSNVTSQILNSRLSEVYVVSTDGGSPQRLLPDDKGTEADPTWSPDGRRVAYGWSASGEFGAITEIRILDLASRQATTVPGSVGISSPRWSPDGRYIAGIGNRSLHVFDMETQRWSTLAEKPVAYNQWSHDSRWIYFLADGEVQRVSVNGGKVERVAGLGNWPIVGWWGWMGLDGTDAPMVLHDVGSSDIYALSLDEK
jgi:eukaryotic-like serine/threonine-protein kinase